MARPDPSSRGRGGGSATRTLHIPKSPEGASLLRHNPDIGRDFAYQDLFALERTAQVSTIGLDEAIASHGIPAPHFIKLDVEGAELEVLEGARSALQHVVGVKSEVAFMPQRLGQPLARDIEGFLVQHGFMLMDFTGPHCWRREATTGAPYVARSRIAFSRGQLAQGDYIFLRDVETIDASGLDGIRQSIRLALVSLCYGYFDHATWILQREPVERYLRQQLSLDALPALDEASRRYGRAVCLRTSYEHLRDLIPLARSLIRTFRR